MSLLDTLRKSLSPELFASVTDALGDDFNYDVVPRSRLNTVIRQRDEARRQLDASTHGADDDDDDNDGDGDGAGAPKQKKSSTGGLTQEDVDKAVRAAEEKAAGEKKDLLLRFAVTEKLRGANVVDPNMVLSAGLIDLTKVVTDDNGNITGGLDEQISEMAEARPYLIAQQDTGAQRGTGKKGGSDNFGAITSKEEFLKLPTDQQLAFKEANPEVFKGFMSQTQI